MKKLLLSIGAMAFMLSAKAQLPVFKWAKGVGGSSDDYAHSITVDASGNTYITGSYKDVVDFDPGSGTSNLTSMGGSDIFILKLDASGNFMWAKSMGGSMDDEGYSVMTDLSGNIYLAGTFEGTSDFDPGSGKSDVISAGGSDAFIAKLDASGNLMWTKTFGGSGDDEAKDLMMDLSGSIYAAGNFRNTVDFDPGSGTDNRNATGMSDMFMLKLDASGNFMWAKTMGGMFDDNLRSIALDGTGNIYATGSFAGMMDFDPGSGTSNQTSNGLSDMFVTKLDASGNFMWAHNIGGLLDDNGSDLTTDASGNVYLTGSFNGLVDFDPGSGNTSLTSLGGSDAFILKLNTTGSFQWARNMGGLLFDNANAIALDISGNVIITGAFQGTSDFDPGSSILNLISTGMSDAFVAKLDMSGNFMWARNMGSTAEDYGTALAVGLSGNIYTAGEFSGAGDFDPGSGLFNLSNPGGGKDVFTQRVTEEGTFVNEANAVSVQMPYPNPGMGVYNFVLNDKADVEIYNANGQLLYHKASDKGLSKIDLTNQPAGLYFVKLYGWGSGTTENHTLVKY